MAAAAIGQLMAPLIPMTMIGLIPYEDVQALTYLPDHPEFQQLLEDFESHPAVPGVLQPDETQALWAKAFVTHILAQLEGFVQHLPNTFVWFDVRPFAPMQYNQVIASSEDRFSMPIGSSG